MNAAPDYRLDRAPARDIAEEVIDAVATHWNDAAAFGELTDSQRSLMWGRMFLNPGSVRGIARS